MDERVSLKRVLAIIFVTWKSGSLDFNVAGMHLSIWSMLPPMLAFGPGSAIKQQSHEISWNYMEFGA